MRKQYIGDAAIGRAIAGLGKLADNLNDRVQDIAVSIVEHANGAGNGDVSRFLQLVKAVKRTRTLNANYLIGWGRAFCSCNVNLSANDGAGKVSIHARDSKAYAQFGSFNVAGAKANNWYDAVNDEGTRALWYVGPTPAEFTPMTIGDAADDFTRFVEREVKRVNGTTKVGGKDVPTFNLTDDDKQQLNNAFDLIKRVAATIARHDRVAALKAAIEKTEQGVDEPIDDLLGVKKAAVAAA